MPLRSPVPGDMSHISIARHNLLASVSAVCPDRLFTNSKILIGCDLLPLALVTAWAAYLPRNRILYHLLKSSRTVYVSVSCCVRIIHEWRGLRDASPLSPAFQVLAVISLSQGILLLQPTRGVTVSP